MKRIVFITFLMGSLLMSSCATAQQGFMDNYLKNYTYDTRTDMRLDSEELVGLLKVGRAQLIDIRFKEEHQAWNMPFAISIPLPELPDNLDKIDKKKLIVTACPHNDRAIIAMIYLKSQGYNVKYLSDGLLGLADYLRGNNALDFIQNKKP